ncbi:MAG: prolipoprotein diacylglyceryl transferase [Gaiellales bacterium]
MTPVLASIPSPSSGTFELGPLTLRAYGIMILLGILAAVWLGGRRWVARGGDWDGIIKVAMWGVAGGVVGARLYHIITSFDELPDEWWGPFAIWRGGLGIWGGILGGVLAGAWAARRHGYTGNQMLILMDAVAPGILLAQAIGRWGNYFNQELFGEPSSLPWSLQIDVANRPAEFADATTFHPTFLYESLWSLIGVVLLLLIDRRWKVPPPSLFAMYVMWYTLGRATFQETLRIDPSHEILGLRLNHYVAIGVFLAAAYALWWAYNRSSQQEAPRGQRQPRPAPATGPRMDVPSRKVRRKR